MDVKAKRDQAIREAQQIDQQITALKRQLRERQARLANLLGAIGFANECLGEEKPVAAGPTPQELARIVKPAPAAPDRAQRRRAAKANGATKAAG